MPPPSTLLTDALALTHSRRTTTLRASRLILCRALECVHPAPNRHRSQVTSVTQEERQGQGARGRIKLNVQAPPLHTVHVPTIASHCTGCCLNRQLTTLRQFARSQYAAPKLTRTLGNLQNMARGRRIACDLALLQHMPHPD